MVERQTGEDTGKSTLTNRRSYLKLLGASAAAVAAGATGVSAAAGDYETVKVPAGETKVVSVGTGDTLENVLYDVTASGAHVLIRAWGDDWTIRNIGIKGAMEEFDGNVVAAGVNDPNSSAVVENFYLGDGLVNYASLDTKDSPIWVNHNHEGDLLFRNVYVEGFSSGIYGSGPGYQHGEAGGVTRIENSYAKNVNISGFRISGDGSYVKDSTVAQTGDVCGAPNGVKNARGIWLKDIGHMLVENCDIDVSGPHGTLAIQANHGATGVARNCRVKGGEIASTVETENISGNPDPTPPAGVPTSAEEAASGQSSASGDTGSTDGDQQDSTELPNVLSVEGGSPDQVATYAFTVGGEVKKSTDRGASINDEDTIDGSSVEGAVAGGTDSFRFSGDLQDLSTDGSPTVYLNGEQVDPAEYGDQASLPNVVSIDGTGTRADYRFAVDGDVKKSTARDASINDEDVIDGSTVEGAVAGGTDSFAFSGNITEFAFTAGSATLYLNDQQVNPADLGSSDSGSESLPNILVIDGSQTDGITEYTVDVSGTVKKSNLDGASINDGDTVDGASVSGSVSTGADAFEFSGFIRSLDLTGGADVTVDYGAN